MAEYPDNPSHDPQVTHPDLAALAARLTQLESEVAALRAQLDASTSPPPSPVPAHSAPPSSSTPHPPAVVSPVDVQADSVSAETWLTRFGVLMLVVGVGFVVRYTAELGWWTDQLKLIGNLALGISLALGGWLLRTRRPGWSTLIAGAGYAVLHISLVGGCRFWELYGQGTALMGISLVAAAGIIDAHLRDNDTPTAVGLGGAWVAPFVLADWAGPSSSGGWFLVLFFGLSALTWWKRASQNLLLLHSVAGLIAAGVLLDSDVSGTAAATLFAIHLLLVSVVAPVRRALHASDTLPSLPVLAPAVGVLAWLGFAEAVDVFEGEASVAAAAGVTALLYAGLHAALTRRSPDRSLSAATTAFLFVGVALIGALDEGLRPLAAAVGCVAAAALGRHIGGFQGVRRAGHLLATLMTCALLYRWSEAAGRAEFDLASSLVDGAMVASLALAGLLSTSWRGGYLFVAFMLTAFGTAVRLTPLEHGPPTVTAVWIALASVALLGSVRRRSPMARWGGITTLGLALTKLLLFDLKDLSPLLRIVLFLSIGAIMILLGWFVPRLVPAAQEQNGDSEPLS